ncbi:MAG: hypothetical protein C0624_09465 [Desulfuromonas sp.]|nr:MAG: hypothetical protein C0624_09465 [Desulfuromonas sp.]
MNIKRFRILVIALGLLLAGGYANAALEWQLQQPLALEEAPVATVSSPDGKRLYVLGEKGNIEVYDARGRLETVIEVPFKAEGLDISADGKRLFLNEAGKKRLQVISLAERYTIPLGDSPFRGPADASVAVVVFSDFQ